MQLKRLPETRCTNIKRSSNRKVDIISTSYLRFNNFLIQTRLKVISVFITTRAHTIWENFNILNVDINFFLETYNYSNSTNSAIHTIDDRFATTLRTKAYRWNPTFLYYCNYLKIIYWENATNSSNLTIIKYYYNVGHWSYFYFNPTHYYI